MTSSTAFCAVLLPALLLAGCGTSQPPPLVGPDPDEPTATAAELTPPASAGQPLPPASVGQPAPPASAGQPAVGPPVGAFTLPPNLSVAALAGRGDNLYVALQSYRVGEGRVARITRAGTQQVHAGPGGDGLRMRLVGGAAVATGPHGMFAIHDGQDWTYRLAPAIDGEGVGAVAIAGDGTVYVAGRTYAVYAQKGDTFTTYRYPPTNPGVMEAVESAGTLHLIGSRGHVMSLSAGSFKHETIGGLSPGSLTQPWVASWVDTPRLTVWLAGEKSLTAIDLRTMTAATHPSPMFFDLQALSGVSTAKGPLLLLGTFGKTALFDGQSWFEADDDGAGTVYIDSAKKHGYAADHGRIRVFNLAHPHLGTGPGKPFTR